MAAMIEPAGAEASTELVHVQVAYVGELRGVMGVSRETLAVRCGISVWEFLLDFGRTHVRLRALLDQGRGIDRGEVVVFRNGLNIVHADHRHAHLAEGDKLVFGKPVGGG